MSDDLLTMKSVARLLKAPPHRLIHLCESDVVKPEVEADGRGTVRRFSPDNVFVAAVALRLQDAGLTVKQLVLVRYAFDWLTRARVLEDEVVEGGLVGAIVSLQVDERPVLLHVALSDFPKGSHERKLQGDLGGSIVAIECGRRLPQPPQKPKPRITFHTDDSRLAVIPTRVVVNLTQLCLEVRHGLSQPR